MHNKNQVNIKIVDESFIFEQSEFWYFKKMIENIYHYYKEQLDNSKIVLIKIPGTYKLKKVNFEAIVKIMDQIEKIFSYYLNDIQLQY